MRSKRVDRLCKAARYNATRLLAVARRFLTSTVLPLRDIIVSQSSSHALTSYRLLYNLTLASLTQLFL